MSALTLQVASDLIAAHIGFVTGSIDREPAMPFKPLATLPSVGEQFDKFFGGGEMQPKRNGESDTERVRAQVAGKSTAASTQSPLKDEQPRRAVSPNPATNTNTPGA